MGATFAERAAAAAGKKTFTDPTPPMPEPQPNTTFAERAQGKAVQESENKAVGAAESKKPARKRS
jgi:hypothetical protein